MLVIIAEKPVVTIQPVNVSATINNYTGFKVGAIGTGLTYQWQYKSATGTKWADVVTDDYDGQDSEELVLPAGANYNGNQYRCVITDNAGNTVCSYSASLRVMVPLG